MYTGPLVECWCCGHTRPHQARGLCRLCYQRWCKRGFTGPGPGPEQPSQAERAREHEHIITTLSASAAAVQLGVSRRTVTRYRRALRGAA